MLIIPAIDLWEGKVVRFKRGDPYFSTVYSNDPLATAKDWAKQGASLLHLVDLSAAFGLGDNLEIISKIIKEKKIKVQVGGGIRTLEKAQEIISLGVERIVIGTKSLEEDFLEKAIARFSPRKIAVGVDVFNGVVAVDGWRQKTSLLGMDFIKYLEEKSIQWIIFTDISRDGMLSGVDTAQAAQLERFKKINFILSGGVSCFEDLLAIKKQAPFIEGVIVGKALYEKKIDLSQAIANV